MAKSQAQDVAYKDIPRPRVQDTGKNRYGLTPQEEVYAQLRAQGIEPQTCLTQANLKIKSYKAYEAKHPAITSRISALQDAAAADVIEKVTVSKEWVINELLRQYAANGKVVQLIDKAGNLTEVPQKAMEAIKCLELIGKEMGMFVDKKEVRVGALDGVSDEELARIAEELASASGFKLSAS